MIEPKKVYTTIDFIEFPVTVQKIMDNITLSPVFILETGNAIYKANSLVEACNLWRNSSDKSMVIRLERLG